MLIYECDNCDKLDSAEPKVVLKGATGTSGGITLPQYFQTKHFCNPECFWQWARKYTPEKTK